MATDTAPVPTEALVTCPRCASLAALYRRAALESALMPAQGQDTSATKRDSALVLFGLHVQTEHPQIPVPDPEPGCAECAERAEVASVYSGASHRELRETLDQHRLGHLAALLPEQQPADV